MLATLGMLLGVIVLLCLVLIGFYNGLVRGKNMVEEAWSGINVQLKRRHDLVPSLVNTIKGYTAHESEVLRHITEARAQAVSAAPSSVENVMHAENGLTRAMRSLFAVAENYPQLQASETFLQLQQQLTQLEDEIQMSRRYYNGAARAQNNRVLQFPGNMLAGMFGFAKVTYFDLDDGAECPVPEVKF